MSSATTQTEKKQDYKIRDINLADWGRKERPLSEKKMPGLMSIREKYAPGKTARRCARDRCVCDMTIQTAVLTIHLSILARVCAGRAAIFFRRKITPRRPSRSQASPVFAWKGESLEEYWSCTYQVISNPTAKACNSSLSDGGDATLLIHKGYELEEGGDWAKTKSANKEEQVIKDLLLEIQRENPFRWHEIVKEWRGVRRNDDRRASPL